MIPGACHKERDWEELPIRGNYIHAKSPKYSEIGEIRREIGRSEWPKVSE